MALTKTLTFNLTATLTGTITSTEESTDQPINYTQALGVSEGAYAITADVVVAEGGSIVFSVESPYSQQTVTETGPFSWNVDVTTENLLSIVSQGSGVFSFSNLSIDPAIIDE